MELDGALPAVNRLLQEDHLRDIDSILNMYLHKVSLILTLIDNCLAPAKPYSVTLVHMYSTYILFYPSSHLSASP